MRHDELSETPLIHPTASVEACAFGRYTEVAERCRLSESSFGD
ncbi:hypothetical protein [Phyllobacterium pellucidum]